MVASAERRKELVKNTIKFLRQNHFDGLDLDWEYPTFRDGGKPRDRDNYAQLVQELSEEFERESEKTGRPRLLLTMAVPAGIEYINKGYDVPKLTKYLDWMNILSYDYHSAFEPAVNHHAPLYSLEEENEYNYDTELNIDYTIKHYLKMGADPNKLVLGIPTYGRSYTLFNPDAVEIGSPADGPGDMGEATRENGYLAYYEICDYVKNQDWEVEEPNPKAMGPIAFKGNQWVGYDDQNVVKMKAEYVVENGLGGIMFWAIDNDDFRGNCHGKPYPLIEAGKEAMLNAYGLTEENLISPPAKPAKTKIKHRTRKTTTTTEKPEESSVASVTPRRRRIKTKSGSNEAEASAASSLKRRKTEASSTYSSLKIVTPAYTTPEPPATPDMGGAFKCEDEGFFPHPKDCKKYYWCLSGAGDSGIVAHQFTCPAGLFFNKAADSCDYSQNVFCNKKLQKATTTQKPDSTTTTEASKPLNSVFSTTRAPPKITAVTSKTTINFRSTTTTTQAPEEDEEYEYEDEEDEDEEAGGEKNKKITSEEDPRVIKELIDLIRKAGGIEELEKQLKFSSSTSSSDSTTPSSISKSLYERVLSKANKSTLGAFRKGSTNRNSGGPQASGEDEAKEKKVERGRPQYRTLTRHRSSTETSDEPFKQTAQSSAATPSVKSRTSSLEYVNIRRPKLSTTTEATNDDDGSNRNKILGEIESEDSIPDTENVSKRSSTPQYVNIRRQKPSTTAEPSTSSVRYMTIRRSSTSTSVDPETETSVPEISSNVRRGFTTTEIPEVSSLRYHTIRRGTTAPSTTSSESTRRRSTTTETTTDGITILPDEKTTIRYQIIGRETAPFAASTTPPDITITTMESSTVAESVVTTTNSISSVTSTQISVTESNSSTLASASSDQTETKKKRPLFYQPTTVSPSTSTKVSRPFRSRVKPSSEPLLTSTTESSAVRSRTRSRLSSTSKSLNEVTEQEEKLLRPVESKLLRSRKRPSTERSADFNEEVNREFRPAELADLSSLTAVDLNLRGGELVSAHRRRRPINKTENTNQTSTVPRTRKVIRRFRPASSTTEKTTATSRRHTFREKLNRTSLSTLESPLAQLFKTKSRFDVSTSTEASEDIEVSTEHSGVINGEEDENIKLSESNIRESSKINAFEVVEKPLKKVFTGRIEEVVTTTTPKIAARILRTRKIVRKLGTTTSTTEATTANYKRRKVLLRRRPTTSEANTTTKTPRRTLRVSTTTSEAPKIKRTFRPVISTTTERSLTSTQASTTSTNQEMTTTEKIIDQAKSLSTTTETTISLIKNTKSSPRKVDLQADSTSGSTTRPQSRFPTTTEEFQNFDDDNEASTWASRLSLYSRPSYSLNFNEDDSEDDEDDHFRSFVDDDIDAESDFDHEYGYERPEEDIENDGPKYTVFSFKRTHQFESSMNFDEDGKAKPVNSTVNSLILTTSLNNSKAEEQKKEESVESTTLLDMSTYAPFLSSDNIEDNAVSPSLTVSDKQMFQTTTTIMENEATTFNNNISEDDESASTISTTTEYHPRSTLRSAKDRPRLGSSRKRTENLRSRPSEEVEEKRVLPLSKLLYRYSTTEAGTETGNNGAGFRNKFSKATESSPVEPTRNRKRPVKFFKSSSTTEAVKAATELSSASQKNHYKPSTTETLGLINTEAVKNRNKQLFSKRKMNTPIVTFTNTTIAIPESTEASLTTLHHVFAEVNDPMETTTESLGMSTNPGKLERLIEVNRIVEVKADAKKLPTVDKIGEISRITLIKIVDGNNETVIIKDEDSNEINSLQDAQVVEVPSSSHQSQEKIKLKDFDFEVKFISPSERQDRKFEVFGESKVANSKETSVVIRPQIIDGISQINVVTPKPLLVTEASTISLQGLFHASDLNPSFTSNDEVLETGRSEFVNVRVLDQDKEESRGLKGQSPFIPVRVLPQEDEESTVRAHVMEISPKLDSRTIKIVPIKVEMSRNLRTQ
ncbi:uncharacterized protein [Euwallacea similis]|uniref:uncharacterized protein isoform X2 n=1 Tax=Euwallacea similis TaxID=1736056 RepID=UPI00344FBF03